MVNTARPPRFLETLLSLFVSEHRRETVTGDLLEEYRATVLPRSGRTSANWWYARETAHVVWSLARPFALLAILILVSRELADWFIPVATPGDYEPRVAVLGWSLSSCHVGTGLVVGWRTGRVAAGTIVSLIVATVSWPVMPLLSGLLSALHVPSVYSAVEISRTPLELAWIVPVAACLILVVTGVAGFGGAVVGAGARRLTPPRVRV